MDYADELYVLLREAMRLNTRGDFRMGTLLSGGLDTRGMLAFWLESIGGGRKVKSFNWGEVGCQDLLIPEMISKKYSIDLHQYIKETNNICENFDEIVWLSEGMGDNAVYAYPGGLKIVREVRKHADVILHGRELFGWGRLSKPHI